MPCFKFATLFFLDAKMEPFSLVFKSKCRGKIRCGFRNTLKSTYSDVAPVKKKLAIPV